MEEQQVSSTDLNVARSVINKLSEAFDNFQSQAVSILSLSEQWSSLRSSFAMAEASLAVREKELEAKEKETSDFVTKVEVLHKEVEFSKKRFELMEESVCERVKEVEKREKEVTESYEVMEMEKMKIVESRMELEVKEKKLNEGFELREKELNDRGEALELKEKKVNEGFVECREALELKKEELIESRKGLALQEKCLNEQCTMLELQAGELFEERKKLELIEKEVSDIQTLMVDRKRELESKEKEIMEVAKRVENLQEEVELREKCLRERVKEVERKEEEMKVKVDAFELEVMQSKEVCKEVELKYFELVETKAKLMEEMKVKENEIVERCRAVEVREKKMDEKCRKLDCREEEMNEQRQALELKLKQINEGCQSVDLKEKEEIKELKLQELNDKQSKGHSIHGQVKISKPQQPQVCNEAQFLCKNMDAEGMRSYLIEYFKNYKESDTLLKNVFDSLLLASDPAKFVLDVIQCFYKLLDSGDVAGQVFASSCLVLLTRLIKLKAVITPGLKNDARKFSTMWRGSLANRCNSPLEIYVFLLFLASFKSAQSYDADELLSLVGTFYTESEVLWPEQDSYLCRILGLKKKIPGLVNSLVMKGEQLRAVVYVCAFKMENDFSPAALLKAHMDCIQKRVQEMIKKGRDAAAQNDAINMELSALKTTLKCISNFKLESSFSPAPLESRLKQLEKEREGKTNAESLSTVRKNLSNSEKKANALPGIDQSQSNIGKKHSATSIESSKHAKRRKVPFQRIKIKMPRTLPGSK